MMKSIAITLLCFLQVGACLAQGKLKAWQIPLDNTKGVPYEKSPTVKYLISGFEIDNKENFYFLSKNAITKKTVLVAIKEGHRLYEKDFGFTAKKLFICGDELYSGNLVPNNHEVYKFDKNSGLLLHQSKLAHNDAINSFAFDNCSIITESIKYGKLSDEITYKKYDMNGIYTGSTTNQYGLNNKAVFDKLQQEGALFLGFYKQNQVYAILDKTAFYTYFINAANVIQKVHVGGVVLGEPFMNEEEFIKLRNNNIYIVTQKGINAVISKVALDSLAIH